MPSPPSQHEHGLELQLWTFTIFISLYDYPSFVSKSAAVSLLWFPFKDFSTPPVDSTIFSVRLGSKWTGYVWLGSFLMVNPLDDGCPLISRDFIVFFMLYETGGFRISERLIWHVGESALCFYYCSAAGWGILHLLSFFFGGWFFLGFVIIG